MVTKKNDQGGYRRRGFLKTVGLGVTTTAAGCIGGGGGGGSETQEIPIGINADLSGPTSFISELGKGIEYYLQYVNENKNGLDGEGQYVFDPVVRDGEESAEAERNAFEFYRDRHGSVVIHLWATPANVALAPAVGEAMIPHMGASKSEAWATKNEYMHLFGTSYEDYFRIYMDWAKENKGDKIAILYSVFLAPAVERVLEERGYQDEIDVDIVASIQHDFAPDDLTPKLEIINERDFDFIIHGNVVEGAVPGIAAINELGIPHEKYGTYNWSTISGLFGVADDTDGIYGINENPTDFPAGVPADDEIEWYRENVNDIPEEEQQAFLYNGWAKGKFIEALANVAKDEMDPQGELPTDDTAEMRAQFQEAWNTISDLDTGTGLPTIDYTNNPLKGFRGATIWQASGESWNEVEFRTPTHPFEG